MLWDLEHLLAFLYALPVGAGMAGRDARPRMPRLGRHEVRLVAATLYWVSAALVVLGAAISVEGPFGHLGAPGSSAWAVALAAGLDVAIGVGLRHGRRPWWRLAVGLTLASLALVATSVVVVVVGGAPGVGTGMLVLALVLDLIQLGVLVGGRTAFRNPGRRGSRAGTGRVGAPSAQDDQVAARADPIGPTAADRQEVLETFVDAADDAGLVPCVFSCTSEVADLAAGRGWLHVQVAEEAVIDLPALEFRGKKWQDVRSALNQAGKQGIEFQLLPLAEAPRALQAQVRAISEEWVGDKGLPEMGFTLGGVEEALDPDVLVGLAVDTPGPWGDVLDAGARAGRGPGRLHPRCHAAGAGQLPVHDGVPHRLGLPAVPGPGPGRGLPVRGAAGAGRPGRQPSGPGHPGRLLERLGEVLEPYYGFRSLTTFKGKFLPRHEPLFLVLPDEVSLARVGLAIGRAYLPEATLADLAAAARAVQGARA